jgi:hypothetical protein
LHSPSALLVAFAFVRTDALIHELGHALLHSDELPASKEVAEVEVESVAYIVCDAIGLDSGDYSFAYVARWAEGSTDLLRETGDALWVALNRSLKRWRTWDRRFRKRSEPANSVPK